MTTRTREIRRLRRAFEDYTERNHYDIIEELNLTAAYFGWQYNVSGDLERKERTENLDIIRRQIQRERARLLDKE